MGQPFDWDLIRSFLAVARAGKLTVGAKHLRIDHSTLSRRIATLEKSLGAKLFDHSVTGYSLTAQGEQLLSRAETVESSILSLDRQFGQSSRISGAVRIGSPDGFGTTVLAPAIGKLAAAHPELEIDLVAMPAVFSLSKREADIALALACPPKGRLHGRKLTDLDFGVYAAKSEPSLWEGVKSRDDLSGLRFISYIEDLLYTPELDYLPEICKSITPQIRSSSLVAQLQAARAGAGLCVLPRFLAGRDESLVQVLPNEAIFSRTLWMIVHSDMKDIERIQITCDFIVEEVRRSRDRFVSCSGRRTKL
ncbi:DNA-binding transcriptional LysR family regulator [Bradyrhizobium sp. AZCC 2262]|uniref:LysR family transcriptional regulator n=1 Tax=Bradyrhizobium sp. AZCC 2262 TaxID=3117022 RepID=UPI002FF1128A